MKIGYARVSTRDQNLSMQIDAFKEAGCERIFQEKKSGQSKELPELDKALDLLRSGDTLFVWALDRLGRSIYQIINKVSLISEKEANLYVITHKIDTSEPTGKVFLTIFALLAELETDLRRERQRAGIESAKQRGKTTGRQKGLNDKGQKKAREVRALYLSKDPVYSIREISSISGVCLRTIYKYLDYLDVPRRSSEDSDF